MQFWANIADAGGERYLKSYCFGTSLSTPQPGFQFGDYNGPRGLETFEPCSMKNFTEYGRWFQQHQVPSVEAANVRHVAARSEGFSITLEHGERVTAARVIVATGLAYFESTPPVISSLPSDLALHTSRIRSFEAYRGRSVAVIGGGQSALEAAALLHEAGAHPQLLVRERHLRWHRRVPQERSIWRKLRSPISGLGAGPKAWALTNFPEALHHMPEIWRTGFVKKHLPPEGAWWLRPRVEGRVPMHLGTSIVGAVALGTGARLQVRSDDAGHREMEFDHVVAGSGYRVDVDALEFLEARVRSEIARVERYPRLNAAFESSVPGLSFAGPTSAMSFGPLFRFVVGADYTARTIVSNLARSMKLSRPSQTAA
jgi:hypothetical protein